MDENRENEEKSVKVPPLLHSLAVIVLLLISIVAFNATLRAALGTAGIVSKTQEIRPINLIFDPDLPKNWTNLCPSDRKIGNKFYDLTWQTTSCYNKTMQYWYIPWVRAWVWERFKQITSERKRLKELQAQIIEERNSEIITEAQTPPTESKIEEETKKNDNNSASTGKAAPPNTVYTILTAMTLMMAIIAMLEIFREKFAKKPTEDARDLDRRCSLADFTIKRHQRKESQQENLQRQAAFDEPKKVNALLHQGSLDRAISVLTPAVKPSAKLPRQRSMPCRYPSMSNLLERANFQALRNASIDLPEEEGSPMMRRKSRHFIRRH